MHHVWNCEKKNRKQGRWNRSMPYCVKKKNSKHKIDFGPRNCFLFNFFDSTWSVFSVQMARTANTSGLSLLRFGQGNLIILSAFAFSCIWREPSSFLRHRKSKCVKDLAILYMPWRRGWFYHVKTSKVLFPNTQKLKKYSKMQIYFGEMRPR